MMHPHSSVCGFIPNLSPSLVEKQVLSFSVLFTQTAGHTLFMEQGDVSSELSQWRSRLQASSWYIFISL